MSHPIAAAWAALQAGQPDKARRMLLLIIQNDPANGQAWYLLAHALADPTQKHECLTRARAHGFVAVSLQATPPGARPGSAGRRTVPVLKLLGLVLAGVLLALGGYALLAVNPQPMAPATRSGAASAPGAKDPATQTASADPAQADPAANSPSARGRGAKYDPFPYDTDNDGSDNNVDPDDDSDAVADLADNCPLRANPTQADVDTDGMGDACDIDADGDSFANPTETFVGADPLDAASLPEYLEVETSCTDGHDNDRDGTVDGADDGCIDTDNDTNPDVSDNCLAVANPGWHDADDDGVGDDCDPTPLPPNTAPSVSVASTFSVDEGSTLLMDAVASDPEDVEGDLQILWDLNDDGSYGAYGLSIEYDPEYLGHDGPSVHMMTVEVRDTWALTATATTAVTVRNLPPVVAPLTLPLSAVAGTPATFSAQFADPGMLDSHSARWDWGDGHSTDVTPDEYAGSGTVSAGHAYAAAGTYTVALTVTDDDGGSSTVTTAVVVR